MTRPTQENADLSGEVGLPSDPVCFCSEVKRFLVSDPAESLDILRPPLGEKQLFLDNFVVARVVNVNRCLHQPKKFGPVIRPEESWERGSVQIWTGGPYWIEEESLWKLWYLCGSDELACHAVSEDGIHWDKPILRRVCVSGSRENNVVALDPLLEKSDNAIENIIHHPEEKDPEKRFKGFSGIFKTRQPIVSPNGLDWQTLPVPEIPSQDVSSLFFDRRSMTFVATLKHQSPYGRSFCLSVSRDFQKWTDPRACLVFYADKKDQELGAQCIQYHVQSPDLYKPLLNRPDEYRTDIYHFPIFFYEGLYVAMPTVFNQSGMTYNEKITLDWADGVSMVELAVSRDLLNWERVGNREKFLPLSPLDGGKNYDTGQLLAGNRPVARDNEIWFYYTGCKSRASLYDVGEGNPPDDRAAICLAKLRRDGFVSLDAGEEEGSVLTKPVQLHGTSIRINLDAADGELRAEILDQECKAPLPGFSLGESRTLRADNLESGLEWTSGKDTASLAGRIVRIHFVLRRARLYAFWLQ